MVKRALEGLKGVQRAEVSFRDKAARVTFERTEVTEEQLIECGQAEWVRRCREAAGLVLILSA